ncbi:hypothetical protein GJM86_10080 [Vibrio parahaemolyticus]|nr:hypothetical protein [Vibrio parahaemolyticus]EGQ8150852.1 hypothetical protein [Vibrio parahaemolyticus]EGQ8152164.1 hypothetical protein [Vibrio parahaemolyticus]EGQ8250840.1 hypothetical protein [Vibrio parahaemolyticus]EGQ8254312.1 hypothetical protein [Vibrio parahaemolyticus]
MIGTSQKISSGLYIKAWRWGKANRTDRVRHCVFYRHFGYNSNLTKKMTQTVAFGVTSQKQLLYNALAMTRWNRHRFDKD